MNWSSVSLSGFLSPRRLPTALWSCAPRRILALLVAVSMVIGNIGLTRGSAASRAESPRRQNVAVNGHTPAGSSLAATTTSPGAKPAGCCCGHRGDQCKCGCCARQPAPASAPKKSCCRKTTAIAKHSEPAHSNDQASLPQLSCPCGGTPGDDFVITGQAKFVQAESPLAAPDDSVVHAVPVSLLDSGCNTRPEIPPPRMPLC